MGCIYMYTNLINGKKYIGQTKRELKVRHWQHCCQKESFFDLELQRIGSQNFKLEILEDGLNSQEELDEKEAYYIQKYNSFEEGYNMTRGGAYQTRFPEKLRDEIIDLIQNTKLSFSKIGEITNCSIYTISEINNGYTFRDNKYNYPIRKRRVSEKYEDSDVETVIDFLKNTNFSFDKIADLTNTNFNFVADINRGKRSRLKKTSIEFPIRQNVKHCKMTKELALSVIYLLKTENNKSSFQISEMLNIPSYTIGQINRGKHSICKEIEEDYPIRKKQYKNKNNKGSSHLTTKQIYEIIELLLNTSLSTEEIAQRYFIDRTAVNRINRGTSFKAITSKFKLPIRQNSTYNLNIYNNSVNE